MSLPSHNTRDIDIYEVDDITTINPPNNPQPNNPPPNNSQHIDSPLNNPLANLLLPHIEQSLIP